MAYIDKEKLIKEIEKLYPGYDEYGMRYLMRSQVLSAIDRQPAVELEKSCKTCLWWDKDSCRVDGSCFCYELEANTLPSFCCTYWEEG